MKKFKKAFTMVELVGVIILLGLITSFMVPAFMSNNAASQAKVLSSKILTDIQAIEMKANECYDTTGSWLTKSGGAALDGIYSDVSSLECNGAPIEGKNRFFTPRAPTGFSTAYQIASPAANQLAIRISWGTTLPKITQNAIADMENQVSLSKMDNGSDLMTITETAGSGNIRYWVTK